MNKMKKIRFLFIYVTKHQMQTKITAKTNRPKDRVFHSWHNQDLICGSVLQHDMSKLSKYCQKFG